MRNEVESKEEETERIKQEMEEAKRKLEVRVHFHILVRNKFHKTSFFFRPLPRRCRLPLPS